MRILLMILAAPILQGCAPETITTYEGVDFCSVEEPRRFSHDEWAWRAENAPWNLRRDIATNLTWQRECEA